MDQRHQYFLLNPLALFHKFTEAGTDVCMLLTKLLKVLEMLQDLFDVNTTFKDVNETVKTVSASGHTMDQEMSNQGYSILASFFFACCYTGNNFKPLLRFCMPLI
jgi:hypothetical protein